VTARSDSRPLYPFDWLLVGYATIYTAAPVFSLVLDKDVDENFLNAFIKGLSVGDKTITTGGDQ